MDSGSEIDAILKPRTVLLEFEIDSMLKPRTNHTEIKIDHSQSVPGDQLHPLQMRIADQHFLCLTNSPSHRLNGTLTCQCTSSQFPHRLWSDIAVTIVTIAATRSSCKCILRLGTSKFIR